MIQFVYIIALGISDVSVSYNKYKVILNFVYKDIAEIEATYTLDFMNELRTKQTVTLSNPGKYTFELLCD